MGSWERQVRGCPGMRAGGRGEGNHTDNSVLRKALPGDILREEEAEADKGGVQADAADTNAQRQPAALGVLEIGGATWTELVLERQLETLHDTTGGVLGVGVGGGCQAVFEWEGSWEQEVETSLSPEFPPRVPCPLPEATGVLAGHTQGIAWLIEKPGWGKTASDLLRQHSVPAQQPVPQTS